MINLPGFTEHPTGYAPMIKRQSPYEQMQIALQMLRMYSYQPEPRGENVWRGLDVFVNSGGGDCEDWAIAIRSILIGMGWSPDNLAIVQGATSTRPHAVLAVWTNQGLFALDQRIMKPTAWDQLDNFKPFAITRADYTAALLPKGEGV